MDDEIPNERSVRSEARGPHWIAWIPGTDGKPAQSVVLVGLTREEAEERAIRWWDEQRGQASTPP